MECLNKNTWSSWMVWNQPVWCQNSEPCNTPRCNIKETGFPLAVHHPENNAPIDTIMMMLKVLGNFIIQVNRSLIACMIRQNDNHSNMLLRFKHPDMKTKFYQKDMKTRFITVNLWGLLQMFTPRAKAASRDHRPTTVTPCMFWAQKRARSNFLVSKTQGG